MQRVSVCLSVSVYACHFVVFFSPVTSVIATVLYFRHAIHKQNHWHHHHCHRIIPFRIAKCLFKRVKFKLHGNSMISIPVSNRAHSKIFNSILPNLILNSNCHRHCEMGNMRRCLPNDCRFVTVNVEKLFQHFPKGAFAIVMLELNGNTRNRVFRCGIEHCVVAPAMNHLQRTQINVIKLDRVTMYHLRKANVSKIYEFKNGLYLTCNPILAHRLFDGK